MWRHYVYIHHRKSNGEPFYVGKGSMRNNSSKNRQTFERAYDNKSRQKRWKYIVNKHGLAVEIVASCQNDEEAQKLEKKLIAEIGRKDLGKGPLINLTDGGDGHCGIIQSKEHREKLRILASGPRSQAFIDSIRKARKNGGNGGVVKKGDKLPESWVRNLSLSKMGDKNPWYGKISPAAKKVKNINTGTIYESASAAAKAEGYSIKALYQWLDGSRLNRSPLVRL